MNGDAYVCEATIGMARGLERTDTLDLNRRLRRNWSSPGSPDTGELAAQA